MLRLPQHRRDGRRGGTLDRVEYNDHDVDRGGTDINFQEYAANDGSGLAVLIAAGEVSAEEVAQCARDAIAEKNPALNAVLATLEDQPFNEGGPFGGAPFLVKELILHAKGAPSRAGSRAMPAQPLGADSNLMQRFRSAGLHLIGTTQTPEAGYCATTETVAFGPVHNPWKSGYSAGGSSGGSAAAVAAGLVPVAHANDGGGSIRIPASCNGLVGLKPTRDRTPTGPDYGEPLFAHGIEYVLTRSVRDCAALLDLVSGPDLGGPHIIAPPPQPFARAAATAPGRLKIAFEPGSMLGTPVDTECVLAAANAAKQLEGLGHSIIESPIRLDFEEFAEHINVLWCVFTAQFVEQISELTGCAADNDHFEAVTLTCADFGTRCRTTTLLAALDYVNRISREVAVAFEGFDVLMSSTVGAPPPPHGVLDQNDSDISAIDWTRKTFRYASNTPLFNSTGQPALSLPLHWTSDDLPVGVQFAAGMGEEGLLLSLATELETTSNWQAKQCQAF